MVSRNFKVIVSAGGTGGHIVPALSVCRELIKQHAEVYYIGNQKSMEFDLVSKESGIKEFYGIDVQKLYRSLTIRHLLFPLKLIKSIYLCIKYMRKVKPDVFIGFGGFVSGAPAIAAFILKIPVCLQEQNCNPGITNKITGFFADRIFLAYNESFKHFNPKKCIHSGNPFNEIVNSKKDFIAKEYSLHTDKKKLLVLGGSQGSLFINNLIIDNLDYFQERNIDILWQTGRMHIEQIKRKLNKLNVLNGVYVFDFTSELNLFYQNCDFVISRGGALSLSEIESFKLPSFIIPLPSAAVNEQYYNALSMQNRGLGMVFEQKERANFTDRFGLFLKRYKNMHEELQKNKSIHVEAAKTITQVLVNEYRGRS